MNAIEIRGFTKQYDQVTAVSGINLTVKEGEIFGFIGQNGAGKSTTIRAILNLIYPTEGSINVFDYDAVRDSKHIKNIVGYVPSGVSYYQNMTVNDLFEYAMSFSVQKNYKLLDELVEYFQLDRNRQISQLSLGNQKKVNIIQSILKNPKLLILDEPTNGLDPIMQEKLFKLLIQLKTKGCTIFLSSHNLTEVEKYCDRVAIIKKGKIVETIEMSQITNRKKYKVTYLNEDSKQVVLEWEKPINQLIALLSKENIVDLEIVKRGVEDEFKKYYDGEV